MKEARSLELESELQWEIDESTHCLEGEQVWEGHQKRQLKEKEKKEKKDGKIIKNPGGS